MVIRIAHLSDLHYGGSFDLALWQSVRKAVAQFAPNFIIVTGDVVDHPDRRHLLSVKGELDTLGDETGAEVFVVPGNHDLFYYGNDLTGGRSPWFDAIFNRAETAPLPAPPDALPFFTRQGAKYNLLLAAFKRILAFRWHCKKTRRACTPAGEPAGHRVAADQAARRRPDAAGPA
jgi:Calcineurin-like phosphoesterase